ncbi:MAG: sulfite exporter TauE/SafE family protein [Isosphaeraceae bacterium]
MTVSEAAGRIAAESEGDQEPRISLTRGGSLGFLSGIVIGAAAGLIGVGGGEFRIPVLLHVLRLPVRAAAGSNTLIGLFVVVLSVARRWGQQPLTRDDLTLGGIMAAVSVVGAVLGARQAHRLSTPFLKRIVCLYLLAVGVWMVVEGLAQVEHTLFEPRGWVRWTLAAVVGFLIAAVSGALGVAGGEMRIPALMYLFAMPVKVAGTVSLIASIPTVAAGAAAYRRLGHLPNRVVLLSLLMGAGSLIGVLIGAALLPLVDKHTIKALLGVILLVATACLMLPGLIARKDAPS